jgi:FkbM family methyltransferase
MGNAPSIDVAGLEIDEAIRAGCYERNEADFIRRSVHQGDTAIDLGAHVGVHTTLLAALVGPDGWVIAIEPSPAHVVRLDAAVRAAGVTDRVTIVTAAAGDAAGERSLLVTAPGQSSHHAWLVPPGQATSPLEVVQPVRVVRVDDVPRRGRVSFMKIDVEGAESLALAGVAALLASDRPVLLVDLHPHLMPVVSGESPGDLIARLRGFGYRCHLLGAGVPSTGIDDTPSNAVTPVVFLPDAPDPRTSRDFRR